jgi:hypothetical protein
MRTSDSIAWRCAAHADVYEAEREAARHSSVLLAARVVDLYHDDGVRERFIYRVSELRTDGRPRAMRLSRGTKEIATEPAASAEERRVVAWPRLRDALRADLERFFRSERSFADSPMRWARGGAAGDIVEEALLDRVGRDPTPLATRYPRRWFYSRDDARWFLPSDMRDVRWDRDAHDAFAEHPAWTARQQTVRERPAAEGSWSTPVFSSRPIAAVFRNHAARITRAADDAIGIVELAPAAGDAGPASRRALVVLERPASADAIRAVAESLRADGIEALWISHPSDWSVALASLAWAPGGRDWHGHGGVVIDSLGLFRADQLARAWAAGHSGLSPVAVRARMAPRVERLQGETP